VSHALRFCAKLTSAQSRAVTFNLFSVPYAGPKDDVGFKDDGGKCPPLQGNQRVVREQSTRGEDALVVFRDCMAERPFRRAPFPPTFGHHCGDKCCGEYVTALTPPRCKIRSANCPMETRCPVSRAYFRSRGPYDSSSSRTARFYRADI
jgi:hypothetical protein